MMKLYNILYNIIVQCLFFCLLITITKSQQLPYKYFNYTESNLGDQNESYLIADIKTYDDGTILIHIIRTQTEDCSKIRGMSLEQKLRIRLIFLNGTVKEIDPKLKLELDPINYCLLDNDNIEYKISKLNYLTMYLNDTISNNSHKNLVNPISIYPLRKPFLLVTYVKTNNSSDPRNYEECGEVIDWNGKSRSNICFDSGASWNDSTIQLNANKKLGFIRSARNKTYEANGSSWNSWLWQHYSIIGLCAIPISYNQTKDNQKSVIFQTEQLINSVSCDETDSFIYCIVSIHFNNGTFNGTSYERIQIFPSGNEFSTQEIYSDQRSLRAKMMSFGDLIFDFTEYNNADKNIYYNIYYYNVSASRLEQLNSFIITNYFSVKDVTLNHTFLLASPKTTDNISWSLLTISLLNSNDYKYNNVFINKTIPSINDSVNSSTTFLNITFNYPVALSALTSSITIYKASDNSIRQRISTTMHSFISISPDGLSIIIEVIPSTFNEYDEQYFVSMDNNFVKGADRNEPLRGIHDGIWILKTAKAILGLLRLTQEASKRFTALQNNQSAYINSLLNDIAKKVPINRSRLSSNNRIQRLYKDQIVIPIRIDAATHENERNASELASDLAMMISFKNITTISFGLTNDLDQNYEFRLLAITIYQGIKDPIIGENFKEWVKEYRNLIAMFNFLIMTDFVYFEISKDIVKSMFTKINKSFALPERINRLEYRFQVAIVCGAFFGISFRNIPQIIIQVSKCLTLCNL
ncbi:hypothetical protein F8M41_014099 [Gigaspora margarita]|uniref:Uncharacterized protein n=1 Tax=Gigaspora margarita TaxID=4874 RepID=A0A8H4ARR0_GIGMA|nr:hypothetical protein F8M41_014099 [Gigaspora margarita]